MKIKKITILAALLTLSGCQTIEKYSQCEQDKNYFNVNNTLFDEYKNNYENGNVKSYYFDIGGKCSFDNCFTYYENLEFYEYNFNNNKFKGIYKINPIKNYKNENCYFKKNDNICYLMKKIEKPESRYHLYLFTSNNINIKKFIDSKYNKNITEFSYQVYSKFSISGSPTGSICNIKRNKNEYNLNSFDVPYR